MIIQKSLDSSNVYDLNGLVELGYLPHLVPLTEGTKRPRDKGWSTSTTTEVDLPHFGKSIGMRCEPNSGDRGLVVLDIDIKDKTQAAAMLAKITARYPGLPRRVGQPPKFAVVFRYSGEETTLPKWTIRLENGEKIEVLGHGQQFVVAGIHPDTEEPYHWPQPLVHRDDLLAITKDQLHDLINELLDGLDVVADSRREYLVETKERDVSHLDDATRQLVEGLNACVAETKKDVLKELYRRENRLDYGGWFAVIVAVRDTFKGTHLEGYALAALEDFSGRWMDPNPHPDKEPFGTAEEDRHYLEKRWAEPPRNIKRVESDKATGYTIRTVQWFLNTMPERDVEPPPVNHETKPPEEEASATLQVPFDKIADLGFFDAPLTDVDSRQTTWLNTVLTSYATRLLESNPALCNLRADEQILILQRFSAKALNEALIDDGYQAIAADTLGVLAMEAAESVVKVEVETAGPAMPNFPRGLVGDIARDVLRRNTYVQRGIALATSLMTVSRLSDHQYVVVAPTGRETALNLFGIVTAPTGAGKDTVSSYLDMLGNAVGGESLLGASMASPQAMGRVLSQRAARAHLILMDEIGKKLDFASSGSGAHEAAVLATAMEMYGRALGNYAGREYAEAKKSVAPVDMPFLCVVGMSTPEALKSALSTGSVWDGFLNRFEYFPAPPTLTRIEKPYFGAIPEDIIDRSKRMWCGSHLGRQIDTQAMEKDGAIDTGLTIKGVPFWPISMTADAATAFDHFDRSHDSHRSRGGPKGALLGRATERAIRIAGLVALGRTDNAGSEIELTADDARWAISWVTYSVHRMLAFVSDGLAASSASELVEEMHKFCVDAVNDPEGTPVQKGRDIWMAYMRKGMVSKSHLTWKFKHSPLRDREAALETLIEAEMLEVVSEESGSRKVQLLKPKE